MIKKTKNVSITVSNMERIMVYAQLEQRTTSGVVNILLERALDALDEAKKQGHSIENIAKINYNIL